ncbi:MAG: DNA repair protein RecN [Bacteroidota bacterium]
MLAQLTIKNFALIDDLNVNFDSGFTTITGETGAGKSILLGALSLVLGKRADLSTLKDPSKKCSIETEFSIGNYGLRGFFDENDLDFDELTIVRREISPSGKSRAFINDTPVTLDILSALGERLVDIHSQHQTLRMTENAFQFRVIDALADNNTLIQSYKGQLQYYSDAKKQLESLKDTRLAAEKELDYNSFLLKELEEAPMRKGVLEDLEGEYAELNDVENIMELLSNAHQLMNEEQMGVLSEIAQLKQLTQQLEAFGGKYLGLNERIQSVAIELEDVAAELEQLSESVEPNPSRLEEVNGQLQQLHDLLKKHQVSTVEELTKIKLKLAEKVEISLNMDDSILKQESKVEELRNDLSEKAKEISGKRKKVIPLLQEQLTDNIIQLGMAAASFNIELQPTVRFKENGQDDLIFQFSANKGSSFGELKKVASGGELSRIMLAIKAILASYEKLPTLIFDEIDTGVSGEISNKMGSIMKGMGDQMQIFSITHLPQVASKGQQQFKVYKEEMGDSTTSHIRQLNDDERVKELAEMLDGKSFSASAVSHAKQLLLQN